MTKFAQTDNLFSLHNKQNERIQALERTKNSSRQSYVVTPLLLNPSMYITLDEDYLAVDQSGNGRNGSAVGGISIGQYSDSPVLSGKTSTDFDGTDDRLSTSYAAFVNGTTRTFAGWANRDVSTAGHALFGSDGANYVNLILVSGTNTVRWQPNAAAGGGNNDWSNAWPGNQQWVHWALMFNESSDNVRLYINGLLVSSQNNSVAYGASPGNLLIGNRSSVASFPFNGKQSHFAVWELALSAAEIRALYLAGL